MVNLFKRLDRNRPPPAEKKIEQPRKEPEPAQKLLDWLQRWSKPTITAREIYVSRHRFVRDKKTTLNLAEVLVEQRRLIPVETHRRDRHKWQIVREPAPATPTAADI